MGKIIYFFMCVVNPVKIRSFKKMPIFVAMLIFVLEFFAILLPSKLYINNHSDYSASLYDKTFALYNIKDTSNLTGFDELKNTGIKVNDGNVSINDKGIMINEFTYYYNEENINVIIIFDCNEELDKQLEEFVKEYYVLFPEEVGKVSDTRVNNIAQYAYYNKLNNALEEPLNSVDDYLNAYHEIDDETLVSELSKINYYELYGVKVKDSNENYCYLFTKDSIFRSTPDETDVFSYSFLDFDISKYNNINEFGKDLSVQMIQKYNEQMFDLYLMYIVIYVLLLPIIGILIIYLFTRKFKKLDSFFDYYKIASLVSVIPAIVACIMSFAFGPGAKAVYIILFIIYSMLMLFKAATMPDEEKK